MDRLGNCSLEVLEGPGVLWDGVGVEFVTGMVGMIMGVLVGVGWVGFGSLDGGVPNVDGASEGGAGLVIVRISVILGGMFMDEERGGDQDPVKSMGV